MEWAMHVVVWMGVRRCKNALVGFGGSAKWFVQNVRHVEGGVPGTGMAVGVSFEWPRHWQKECGNVCVQIR